MFISFLRNCCAYRVAVHAPAALVVIYSYVMRAHECVNQRVAMSAREARKGCHPRKLIEEPNKTACQLKSAFYVIMTDADTDERGMAGISNTTSLYCCVVAGGNNL